MAKDVLSRLRKDIEIDRTTHGWKVLSDYGNKEEGWFNEKKEAENFALRNFPRSRKELKKVM